MKTKIPLSRLSLALGVLITAHFVRAGTTGPILVDVVVDMTDAGAKVRRPTPDKPAYYLPLPVGYEPKGAKLVDQKPPPQAWEIEHLLAVALAQQGYLLMTKTSPPSLALTLRWGYMAPQIMGARFGAPLSSTNTLNITMITGSTPPGTPLSIGVGGVTFGGGKAPPGNGLDPTIVEKLGVLLPTEAFADLDEMSTLVAGQTDPTEFTAQTASVMMERVRGMTRQPRHYLMVQAFDFNDWLHHKATMLWTARVSTESWGRDLGEVLPTMIATAAPMFGRQTIRPHLLTEEVIPPGRVLVGTPEVKDYPTPTAPLTTPKNQ